MWDVSTGAERWSSPSYESGDDSVSFSGDGRYIAAVQPSKVVLLDVADGHVVSQIDEADNILLAPDGHTAYIMMGDQGALWDVSTGAHLRDLKGEETTSVKKSAFSADGRLLATTGGDKAIRVWDVATGELLQTLVGHTEIVFQPTFSLDDATLLSGSLDGSAKLWDIATGTTLRTFVGHTASVYANALSPDGRFAVTGGKDGTVPFWDIEAPAERDTLSGPSSFMYGLAWSPDGKLLFAGNADGTSQLWDVATQAVTQRLESDERIDSAAFSPDGSLLLTSSGGGSSTLWDPSSGKQIAQLNGSGGGEPMAGFTADGRAAIGPVPPLTDDGVPGVGEWDVATRELIRRFEMDDYSAGAIAPDGSLLFTYQDVPGGANGIFWNAADGTRLRTSAHDGGMTGPARATTQDVPATIDAADSGAVLLPATPGTGGDHGEMAGCILFLVIGGAALILALLRNRGAPWTTGLGRLAGIALTDLPRRGPPGASARLALCVIRV